MEVKGIGPVSKVDLGALDAKRAGKGKTEFESKCSACHKIDEKVVGPAIKGITTRRTPEWIMNMILNPVEMTQKDPIAKELLEEHLTQMTFQNVSQDEARDMLEYFRQVDEQK
ncbi:MAG: cytochrome c [Leptospiraceae bacterium]|nr:cytochrome c [Leptospiraceae bacterium]MCK6382588.1 cytochrome c [Leptospiraceae bacterium]